MSSKTLLWYYLFKDCMHFSFNLILENIKQNQSEMTKVFASLKKAVDKLHFRGHRGTYCHENCDPNAIKELDGVNTPVCEQTFSWLNKFHNCRNMNEARFFFYFLYLIDLRNLDKEKKVIQWGYSIYCSLI